MSGQSHGPQASRLYAHLRAGAVHPERTMTILDLLRTRGPMSTAEVAAALGHNRTATAGRYLGELEAEGLAEVVTPAVRGSRGRKDSGKPAVWAITEHGRTIA